MKLKILTEFIFLIPMAITFWFGLYIYTAIIALSLAIGILYHLHEEKKFFELDVFVSLILIATNLYFVYLSSFKFPYFHLALISLLASIYFWTKGRKTNYQGTLMPSGYDFNHSMWHISSMLITLFCILAYIIN